VVSLWLFMPAKPPSAQPQSSTTRVFDNFRNAPSCKSGAPPSNQQDLGSKIRLPWARCPIESMRRKWVRISVAADWVYNKNKSVRGIKATTGGKRDLARQLGLQHIADISFVCCRGNLATSSLQSSRSGSTVSTPPRGRRFL